MMNVQRSTVRGRHKSKHPFFSAWMILILLAGGLLGPGLLPTQAAPPPQSPYQTVTLAKEMQPDFSPQDNASYGEVITYTLRYVIPAGTSITNVILNERFDDPTGAVFLTTEYVFSEGPINVGAGTPPVAPVSPNVTYPEPGRPELIWNLADINNGSGSDYIYEIRYHMLVPWDNNGNTNRQAYSYANLTWSGGQAGPAELNVRLLQPHNFSFNKTQQLPPGSQELGPGAHISWTLSLLNNDVDYQGVAYDLSLTDTMPVGTTYQGYEGPTPPTVVGNHVYWTLPSLDVGDSESYRIFAQLPLTGNVAHDQIFNVGDLRRSSCPGPCPDERTYDLQRNTTTYVRNIEIEKWQYSPDYGPDNPANTNLRAEAGEYVTFTAVYTVPTGLIIYSHTVRIFLEDGLVYDHMISPTVEPNIITDTNTQDPWRPGNNYVQLEWANLAPIVNTDAGPVGVTYQLVARVQQKYALTGQDIPHNTLLDCVPLVRWSDQPNELPDDQNQYLRQRNTDSNDVTAVRFIRPDLRYQSGTSGSYFDVSFSGGGFGGGATINFMLHLRNRIENPPHPNAYEIVLTDTISPELTYVNAVPTPDSVVVDPDGTTHIQWILTDPIETSGEQLFSITASLPPTLVAGTPLVSTAQARYSTFEGNVPGEGDYLDTPYTVQEVVIGGYEIDKAAATTLPNNNVRIGDVVDYSIALTLSPGMVMYFPSYNDLLPRGFHYVDGSLQVNGTTVLTGPVVLCENGVNQRELLSWGLDTINNAAGSVPYLVTIDYQAVLSGTDCYDLQVYAANRGEFVSRPNVRNELDSCWRATSLPGAESYCLQNTLYADNWVVQPFLADDFDKTRRDVPTDEYEVGELVRFQIQLHNTGQGPGYDIIVEDMLPDGIAIQDSWLEPSTPGNLVDFPAPGSTGVISWTVGQIDAGASINVNYDAIVLNTAIPGDWLTNTARILDYSSQPGDSNPYDRHYSDYPDPIPPADDGESFLVLGLSLEKSDAGYDPIEPGETLVYRLWFGNTSQEHTATNVRITDTWDANLTYMDPQFSDPDIYPIALDLVNRTVVWGINQLDTGGSHHDYWIDVTFTVDRPMDQENYYLYNYAAIDGQGDMTGIVERIEDTRLAMPFLTMNKLGYPSNVYPGDLITYTLVYSNIGVVTATTMVVEENYDPNVIFWSASPPPDEGVNRWNVGDLAPAGGSGTIRVTVRVDEPVPADVETIYNTASMYCDEVFSVDGPMIETGLFVPRLLASVQDSPDPVDPGAVLGYTIQYTNSGLVATNVILKTTLDPYAHNVLNATPGFTCYPNNTAAEYCTWDLGTLYGGQQSSAFINVQVAERVPSGHQQLINTVSLESDQVGPREIEERTTVNITDFYIFLPVVAKSWSQ